MIEFDVIGPLFDPPETEEAEPIQLGGWHVNTTQETLTLRPELSAYVVAPSSLRRVWAGDDPLAPVVTVALRFDDASQAAAVI